MSEHTHDNKSLLIKDLSFRWPNADHSLISISELFLDIGENLFVLGASGSGKTTLLNIISGILVPSEGQVYIHGTELYSLSAAKRDKFRSQHIGLIFQQLNLISYLSVLENVLLPAHFSGQNKSATQQRAKTLLTHLGINEKLFHAKATALSVGQQQRVAIARALLMKPELIIADEPTSALDADNRDAFIQLLLKESQENGASVIFVSHDRQLQHYFTKSLHMDAVKGVSAC